MIGITSSEKGEEANCDTVKGKTRAPVEEEDDEEAELRKLQAEMAM